MPADQSPGLTYTYIKVNRKESLDLVKSSDNFTKSILKFCYKSQNVTFNERNKVSGITVFS